MDYSKYSYQRLLEYIDKKVQQREVDFDLVQYLLTMEHAKSIEELVEIYNNTFKKLAILFFDSEDLPYNWYDVRTWGYQKEFILTELNCCFNENLLKWFRKQDNPTKELINKCLVNLRDNINSIEIDKELIMAISKDENYSELASIRKTYFNCLHNYIKDRHYPHCLMLMAGNGRILDAYEMAFGESVGVEFDKLKEQYDKYLEQEQKKRIEEEIKAKEEKKKRMITLFIKLLIVIVASVIFYAILDLIGGLLGLIIIIGLLGNLPKILTGKL